MKRIYPLVLIACILAVQSAMAQHKSRLAPKLTALYAHADSLNAQKTARDRKPVIGITTTLKGNSLSVGYNYVKAISMAGGTPYLIASTDDPQELKTVVGMLDGLLMTGGPDVDPAYFGHERHPQLGEVNDERDVFELLLFKAAHERKMPIFGICRGLQMINVAMGGTLWQDIPSDFPQSELCHRQTDDSTTPAHDISIIPGTVTAKVFGLTSTGVNSRHHQCIKDIAPELRITAWSPDSVPEMIEGYPRYPILAIQSHPEIFTVHGDKVMPRFFHFLIKEAKQYHQKKATRTVVNRKKNTKRKK